MPQQLQIHCPYIFCHKNIWAPFLPGYSYAHHMPNEPTDLLMIVNLTLYYILQHQESFHRLESSCFSDSKVNVALRYWILDLLSRSCQGLKTNKTKKTCSQYWKSSGLFFKPKFFVFYSHSLLKRAPLSIFKYSDDTIIIQLFLICGSLWFFILEASACSLLTEWESKIRNMSKK